MDTKNRQKMLVIGAAVAVGLYLANTVIIDPLTASWKARAVRITELRDKVAKGEYMVKRERITDDQWDQMRTNALPSNPSMAEAQLLKSFERWERNSGLARLSIKPQWKQVEDSYMTLECRADYVGDVDRLTRFLYEVERDPLGLKVDTVEIASRDDGGRQLSLGLQVSGLMLNPPASTQP